MKAMFIGGRLHQEILEIPKGKTAYSVSSLRSDGTMTDILYEATAHPQIFVLSELNGVPVVLPLDYYSGRKFNKWMDLLNRVSSNPDPLASTPKTER